MTDDTIYNETFWLDQWRKFNKNDRIKSSPCENTALWDRMAKNYKRNEKDDLAVHNREKNFVKSLVNRCVIFPGARILDIGCGPGNYAIKFAREGAVVTAIDISEKMLQRFEDETPNELNDKIERIHVNWVDFDLKSTQLEKQFDLVFANMTPAVSSPEGFLKMLDASKSYCLYASWVGKRKKKPLDELTSQFFNKTIRRQSMYFSFAFNLLLSMGFLPETEFERNSWEKEETIKEVYEQYCDYFSRFNGFNIDKNKDTIHKFLRQQSINGYILKQNTGTIGRIIWDINKHMDN